MFPRQLLPALLVPVLLWAADPAVKSAQDLIKAGKYDDAISTLDGAYKKSPKSDELRKAIASAHLAKADFNMFNNELPPRVKYPTALREYRKVLEFDKDSKKAKDNIATIENIYKSMGRPVPQ